MDVDEALDMAETWQALPDANGAAHVLAAEVRRLRAELTASERRVGRVLGLHRQVVDSSWPEPGHCVECWNAVDDDYVPYPCSTVRVLEDPSTKDRATDGGA